MAAVTVALFVMVLSAPYTSAQDDPYTIFLPVKSSGTGLASCYKAPPRTRTVKFYSLVSAAGNEFVRQNVPDDVLSSCIQKGTTVLKASNIVTCLNAADKAGMGSFTFASGVCTGYMGWRKIGPTSCPTGTNIVYVKKKYTPPFIMATMDGGEIQYTLENNLSVVIALNVSYPCGYGSYFGAKLTWGKNETVIVKNDTTQVTVPRKALCYYQQNITVSFISSNGTALNLPFTYQLDITQHLWFGMPNGGCFNQYSNGTDRYNHSAAQSYCRSFGLDLYTQTNRNDTVAIMAELATLYIVYRDYFDDVQIDLTWVNGTTYVWRGGQVSDTSDTVIWMLAYGYPCVVFYYSHYKLHSELCSYTSQTASCYDPSP